MSDDYTDEDVTTGVMAAGNRLACKHELSLRESDIVIQCDLCDTRAILAAVTPAIVARAKAEAWDEGANAVRSRLATFGTAAAMPRNPHRDEIERAAREARS